MVKGVDLPIFICDSGDMGNGLYKDASLVKKYPEKYLSNKGKSCAPEVSPVFKYKIKNNRFLLLGRFKSQKGASPQSGYGLGFQIQVCRNN